MPTAHIRALAFVAMLAATTIELPICSYAATPLATLRPGHPRLFLHDSDLPALKQAIAADPFVKWAYEQMLTYGNGLLTSSPDVYQVRSIGGVVQTRLGTSRRMEGRIFTLAGLYRITGEKRYADRATREMLAAASFPDWDPMNFLATGEMTAALGLGYDWLYSTLSPADRATIKNAIATKGIDPWLERIKSGEAMRHEHNNWNQVCNGGESIGALAIADEEPERARGILEHAHTAIANIMQLFAPDGGFEEGPTYWLYATSYNVLYIDALNTALGTDFGISNATGFSSTGDYHMQAAGPTYLDANFGDAHEEGARPAGQMFWLARRFDKPAYAAYERAVAAYGQRFGAPKGYDRFTLFLLLWSARASSLNSNATVPLEESFSRVAQAYMRSAWSDSNAWYVGFKGGDGHASHGHLDLGSFVMDALGQRWASDLGADSYQLPQYFSGLRWTYYRMRTEGHNTLTIDGENQDREAKSPLTASGSAGEMLYAIADLDKAYKTKLSSWSRGVALLDSKRVLVQDEISPSRAVDVAWNFHTFAKVEILTDGRSAALTEGGATLSVRILSPVGARFTTASTQTSPPQSPNPGLTNLVIPIHRQSSPATIAVLFTQTGDKTTPRLKPLAEWK